MSLQEQVYQWSEEKGKWMVGLSKPQRQNMALFVVGVIEAEKCQLAKVGKKLKGWGKAESVERRLQRLLNNGHIEVEACQRAWIRWVMGQVEGERTVVLVDEVKLSTHLSTMMVSLAYRKRAIPLTWRSYQAKHYPAEGQVQLIAGLLEQVAAELPGGMLPLVEVDRGLGTSPDLVRVVERLGWTYLFRVQGITHVQLPDGRDCQVQTLTTRGHRFSSPAHFFKDDGFNLHGQVHVIWQSCYDEPWCLLTNDPTLSGGEYAWRSWQEQSFKDLKSGGFHWDDSHGWKPSHADRLLLVLAIAYAFLLSLGTAVLLAPAHLRRSIARGSRCRLGVFRLGLRFLNELLRLHRPVDFFLDFVHDASLIHPQAILC
jgi:hypothetical protein